VTGRVDVDAGTGLLERAGSKRFEAFDGGGWLGLTPLDAEGLGRAVRVGPDREGELSVTGGATEWTAPACPQ
jgi:hypothetical protein